MDDISHYKNSCSKSFNLWALFDFLSRISGKELAGHGEVMIVSKIRSNVVVIFNLIEYIFNSGRFMQMNYQN